MAHQMRVLPVEGDRRGDEGEDGTRHEMGGGFGGGGWFAG